MAQYMLLDIPFDSKKAMIDFFDAEKVRLWSEGGVVPYDMFKYLIFLFKQHRSWKKKIPEGQFDRMKVVKNKQHEGLLFAAVRKDGVEFPFSVSKMVMERSKRTSILGVLRNEVREQTYQFKRTFFDSYYERIFQYDFQGARVPPKCPIKHTIMTMKKCHVDHFEPQFVELVDAFMAGAGLKLEELKIESGPRSIPQLVDRVIVAKWRTYHANTARLRVISISANQERKRSKGVVSATGFEPAASCAQGTRSSQTELHRDIQEQLNRLSDLDRFYPEPVEGGNPSDNEEEPVDEDEYVGVIPDEDDGCCFEPDEDAQRDAAIWNELQK